MFSYKTNKEEKNSYKTNDKGKKQAEAEVVPSSSLVDVEFEVEVVVEFGVEAGVKVGVEVEVKFHVRVEVGVEVEVKVRAQNYFFGVVGWVAEEMRNKTNLPT